MKLRRFIEIRHIALIVGVVLALAGSGCGPSETAEPVLKAVFFPKPPDKPRLQFLKSFSGPQDLGAPGPSAFELFILGEPEITQKISGPYGLAMHDGKLYVCDIGRKMVEVLDLQARTFGYLTEDRRLANPVNIYITDDGMKYVTDPVVGAVFVFDRNDALHSILGKELKIAPLDVAVQGQRCYVTDFNSNQVVVLDKVTGAEILRMGQEQVVVLDKVTGAEISRMGQEGDGEGQFRLISDLAVDGEGNVYVTDKVLAHIVNFDSNGVYKRTIGRRGRNVDEFVRPKGISVDRENRIWVVDAAVEIAKIYDKQGRLLLYFGRPGNRPGMMNLPAQITVDYDNVELFRKYAVEGANLEFLVLVSNQYGLNKINVYGFGEFPQEYGQAQLPGQ